MKTLLTFLTIALFSFGANAQVKLKPLKKEFFEIVVKEYPAKECLKAFEKGKYVGKYQGSFPIYLLDGILYNFKGEIVRKKNISKYTLHYQITSCKGSKKIY